MTCICPGLSPAAQCEIGKILKGRVMVAKRVCYEGRVQGVGFRHSVKSLATGHEVLGWVKNLMDGRVEVEGHGEAPEPEAFLGAILDSDLQRHSTEFLSPDR